MQYFTKDNITFVLAVIGSVGTVVGWVHHWICTRENISINLVGYRWHSSGLLTFFQFTNNSLQTITIKNISSVINNSEYLCSLIPVKVFETTRITGNEIVSHNDYYSIEMPLTLSPLCGNRGYVYFPFQPEIQQSAPSNLTFVIRTNRGRAIKKTLPLNKVLDC